MSHPATTELSKRGFMVLFNRDSETYYEMAASKDKDFIVIEGATHGGTPCTACETTPGQYSNTTKNFFDYVAKWINARY